MTASAAPRYTGVAIALHWAMAFLLVFMIWLGWNMDENETRYQLHKSIGITILFLAVARLGWRFANPPPALPSGMSRLEKSVSQFVHIAFYVLMIAIPLSGWLMVSVSPFQVSTVLYGVLSWPHLPFTEDLISERLYETIAFLHGIGAWAILALLGLHVAGALKHEFATEEGVLKRMVPGLFGVTTAPALPGRGALFAFGGSLALFAIVAAAPLLAGAGGAPLRPPSTLQAQPAQTHQSNWDVDYPASVIAFSGTHDGRVFEGRFESWRADVAFYPENLPRSAVRVVVATASAKTGTKLYDDSLKGKEWFSPTEHPEAVIELRDFRETGSGYEATATLSLKGQSSTVPIRFTLDIAGTDARLLGSAVLSRKALDLGQQSDPQSKWIGDTVTVTISGRATRVD